MANTNNDIELGCSEHPEGVTIGWENRQMHRAGVTTTKRTFFYSCGCSCTEEGC